MGSPQTSRVKVHAAGVHGEHVRLRHGQFFGQFQSEAEVGGFSLAHVSADPGRDVQRHTHDAAHFIFVTRGLYVSSADGAPDVAARPILIYNPPGTTHRDRFREQRDGGFEGRFLSISISPDRMKSIAENATLTERAIVVPAPQAIALTARLIAEMGRWESASPLVSEGICLELAACVVKGDSRDGDIPPRWLSTACDILREEGAERSVSEVAAECGVHPVHLARMFRRFIGLSPGAYLRRCRLERAADLLQRRSLTLTEVALRSGFADQSHMSRAFRSAFSVTPAAYRRHCGIRTFDSDNDVAGAQDGSREPR